MIKTRTYLRGQTMFCPSCHRRVEMPFKGSNVSGRLVITCGACKFGQVVIAASDSVPDDVGSSEMGPIATGPCETTWKPDPYSNVTVGEQQMNALVEQQQEQDGL